MSFTEGKINAKDAKEIDQFDAHLATKAYVNGFTPSQEDNLAFKNFHEPPSFKHSHLARWYKHIASYNEKERSAWPKQSTSESGKAAGGGDDDFDLFNSDSEDDAEKERVKQERLKAYAEKKSKKPGPIAKSTVIYDVKPWDDTIEPSQIEAEVRKIETDGLVWGPGKSVPVAFGIKKLQISCVVEDEKVSTDWLEEQIMEIEDLVQSVDVVAFNKV